MSQPISLKDAERKVFRTRYNDGLWDIFLGCIFLTFVIALYLSLILGDIWSSVAQLPFWALSYLAIWLIRKYVVTPRIGRVTFGQARKAKLAKFTFVMIIMNIIALILGVIAALSFGSIPGQITSIIFGMTLLLGFSLAAFFLGFNRLYIYGLLVGLSPPVGEWLWTHGYATHHGFPITFGTSAGIMIITGFAIFVSFIRDNPVLIDAIPSDET